MATLALALTLALTLSEEDRRWLTEESSPTHDTGQLPVRNPLVEGINARGIAAFRQAALADTGGNVIVSPFALSLSRDLAAPASPATADAKVRQDFHRATLAYLGDSTRELFARFGQKLWDNPDSQAVDAWVFKSSGASLKSLALPDAKPGSRTGPAGLLTQVLYLQGYWLDLRGHAPQPFFRPDGVTDTVPMLAFAEPHVHVDSVRILRLPFAEGRYSLVLVLPDSGRSLAGLIHGLNGEEWRIWMGLRPLVRSRGAFPELHLVHFGSDRSARPHLRYGIRLEVGNDRHKIPHPKLDWVIQAARTPFYSFGKPSKLNLKSDPIAEFKVDRPFLFAIRDTRTGLLLMLGRVADPSRRFPL